MQRDNLEMLKNWSKDEESFQKLKEMIEGLVEERDQISSNLELLESAIRSDYDSILITELNLEKPGPKIVYVNDGFCKMTGYSREEVIGKTPRILQGPKTDRAVLDKLKKRLIEGQSFFGQAINYRKDGSEFVNQWDIHPLTDGEGNITHWVSYQHDISKRKRSEQHLVDQKVEFDSLREEAHRTVVDVDVQGNMVMANKSFRELIGYRKDELKQLKFWDLFQPKFTSSLKELFDKEDEDLYFGGKEFKGIIVHQSGAPIEVKWKTRILDLKEHKLVRAEFENISLKKRVVNTLKKRNLDYSRMMSKVSELNYVVAFEGDSSMLKSLSDEFPQLTGISNDTVVGKETAETFIHEDDIDQYRAHLKKVRDGKESTCEYRLKNKEGDFIEVLDYGKPKWDAENKNVVAAVCAISVDDAYLKMTEV